MAQVPFHHQPVMLDEVIAVLGGGPAGLYVDCTLGGGGHTAALLDQRADITALGIDRDADAVTAATDRLAVHRDRVTIRRARFDSLPALVGELGVGGVAGVLFDLGVSSPQFDRPDRGFSYRSEAALDMRMDTSSALTAHEIVNTWPAAALASLFAANGEGRFARRIAERIVAARPVDTTSRLADVVKDAIPAATRRTGGHPAKRVFQALRIEVNSELEILPSSIDQAIDLLVPGGRCVVLSYHSGEDRIVKDRFRHAETGGCICPPKLPCGCGAVATGRLLFRGGRTPTAAEIETNPRAESARLRAIEKLHPPATEPNDTPARGGTQ